MSGTQEGDDVTFQELRSALDEEIGSLSEKYRTPIVLCYLEGKSHNRAAKELGCPKSTLESRLASARELLRHQLERRGITLAVGALATSLAEMAAGASMPALLTIKTVKVAALVAAGKAVADGCISAHVLALAEEALTGMLLVKGKLVVMVMALGLAVGGAGWAGYAGLRENAQPASVANTQAPAANDQVGGPAKKDRPIATDQYGDPLPEGVQARLGTLRFRHDGQTANLLFSPDGKILVKRANAEAIIWDAETGRELYRFTGLPKGNWGSPLDIAPDGSTLAFVNVGKGNGAKLTLLSLRDGKFIRTFDLPGNVPSEESDEGISFLRFAPDGKRIVYADPVGRAHVLNGASGQLLVTVKAFPTREEMTSPSKITKFSVHFDEVTGKKIVYGGPASHIRSLAVSPDNKLLALGVPNGPVLVNMSTGNAERWLVRRNKGSSFAIAFSSDERKMAWDDDDWIVLSDPITGKELSRIQANSNPLKMAAFIKALAFLPDGRSIVSGNADGKVRLWSIATGKLQRVFDGRVVIGDAMAVSPSGETAAFGGASAMVHVWNLGTGKELFADFQGHESPVNCLAFAPDGKTLFSSVSDSEIRAWSTTTWKQIQLLPANRTISIRGSSKGLAVSPDGKRLASVTSDKTVRLWDRTSGKEKMVINIADTDWVVSTMFSADGRKLFTLDHKFDGKGSNIIGPYRLRHWDVATGRQEQYWKLPLPVHALVPGARLLLDADGKLAFTGEKGVVRLYDVELGRERVLRGRSEDWFAALALSSDARVLAAGSLGGSYGISLWEVVTGKEIGYLKGHERSVSVLAWSADGRVVASGDTSDYSRDRLAAPCVRLWDVTAGMELARFSDFKSDVVALSFSPDGNYLVAGFQDSTMLVWNVAATVRSSRPMPKELTHKDLEARWADLAADDARKAHDAIWTFVASPRQTVPFLQARVRPVPAVDAIKYQEWITNLGSDQLAVREAAVKELEGIGGHLKPFIEKTMKEKQYLETHRRLEQILKALEEARTDTPSLSTLRTIRAIMVLERVGSPEAQAMLETLSRGAPGARETEESRASLERLSNRPAEIR